MVIRRPVVSVSGLNTQLPDGDTIEGGSVGNLIAGSGIVEGDNADLSNNVDVSVALAPNASGVIYVDDKFLGDDGAAQTLAALAVTSGVFATEISVEALASGSAAVTLVDTAVASGLAAADIIDSTPGGAAAQYLAATDMRPGYAVGFNDQNQVEAIRYVSEVSGPPSYATFETVVGINERISNISCCWNSKNNFILTSFRRDSTLWGQVSLIVIGQTTTPVTQSTINFYVNSTISTVITDLVGTDFALIVFYDNVNLLPKCCVVEALSNGSLSAGSISAALSPFSAFPESLDYDETVGDTLVVTNNNTGNITGLQYQFVGTNNLSVSSISTPIQFTSVDAPSGGNLRYCAVKYLETGKFLFAFGDPDNGRYGTGVVMLRSGSSTTLQQNSKYVFKSSPVRSIEIANESSTKGVITYQNISASTSEIVSWELSGASILSYSSTVTVQNPLQQDCITVGYSIPGQVYVVGGQSFDVNRNEYDVSSALVTLDSTTNLPTVGAFRTAGNHYRYGNPGELMRSTMSQYGGSSFYSVFDENGGINYGGLQQATRPLVETVIKPTKTLLTNSTVQKTNFLGVAKTTVPSGSVVDVGLQTTVQNVYTGLQPDYFYYLDPSTSGITANSTPDPLWYGTWRPVGRALSPSGLLVMQSLG